MDIFGSVFLGIELRVLICLSDLILFALEVGLTLFWFVFGGVGFLQMMGLNIVVSLAFVLFREVVFLDDFLHEKETVVELLGDVKIHK